MMLPVRNTFVEFSAPQALRRTKSCVADPLTSVIAAPKKLSARRDSLASTAASDAASLVAAMETRTTLIVRHIHQDLTQRDLLTAFAPMSEAIDFFYLPADYETGSNLGYAFINLVDAEKAAAFMKMFQRMLLGPRKARKALSFEYASKQGYKRNVQHFRNSLVMREAPEFHPVIFENGVQMPFPKPTRSIGSAGARLRRNANRK